MTVTELLAALRRMEAEGHGGEKVILDDDPYLEFDCVVASEDGHGTPGVYLVNSHTPGHR